MGTEETVENKEETKEEKKENVFHRVKERLSMRSRKKQEEKESQEQKVVESDKLTNDDKAEVKNQETTLIEPEKKNKEENIFRKLIRRLSFRSKKKKGKNTVMKSDEVENEEINDANEEPETDPKIKSAPAKLDETDNDMKSLSDKSDDEDMEIRALCKDDNEEKESPPSIPVISTGRPPLPNVRRPPISATTAQSRPVSQLDAALKQFKLSTAASRENLRSSRVDISQVEEQVRVMVSSRPSTPVAAGWRSRAPPENTNLMDQWSKLSASMTDLR